MEIIMSEIKFGLEIAAVVLTSIVVLFAVYVKFGEFSSKKED
jgi:hypothetical protein